MASDTTRNSSPVVFGESSIGGLIIRDFKQIGTIKQSQCNYHRTSKSLVTALRQTVKLDDQVSPLFNRFYLTPKPGLPEIMSDIYLYGILFEGFNKKDSIIVAGEQFGLNDFCPHKLALASLYHSLKADECNVMATRFKPNATVALRKFNDSKLLAACLADKNDCFGPFVPWTFWSNIDYSQIKA